MIKHIKSVVAEPVVPEEVIPAVAEPVVPEEGDKGTASVYSKGGQLARTYSKDAHGKDYRKLAEGYAAKVKGEVK